MTKKDIVEQVARKAHLTKKAADEAIEVFLNEMGRVLAKGEKIVLSGFGTFRVISMKGKTVKIPQTEKFVTIKAHRSPRFTPGKRLKRQVVAGEYRYFPIDQTQVSTYPLKTAKEAYDNLVNGKGYIADLGLNTNGKIIIRKIYLANYDPDTQTDFFQPIVVFEGDNGFVAYVPAVTDAYYQQK